MRLIFFLLVLTISCSACVFEEGGAPKKALVTVLDTLYLPYKKDARSIFENTKPLLRKEGMEAKDLCEKKLTYEQKNILLGAFAELGLQDAVRPAKAQYDDVLVLGCFATEIQRRLEYLIDLYNHGVRFKRIFFLTGERMRDPHYEPDRVIFFTDKVTRSAADVETEAGIMRVIWLQLDKPKELAEMKPVIINAKKRMVKRGVVRRPNTYDTATALIQGTHAVPGREWLAISSQPYISYQDALLKRVMPDYYGGMTVGPEAPKTTLISQYLDSLARTVHNEFWLAHPECTPIN